MKNAVTEMKCSCMLLLIGSCPRLAFIFPLVNINGMPLGSLRGLRDIGLQASSPVLLTGRRTRQRPWPAQKKGRNAHSYKCFDRFDDAF